MVAAFESISTPELWEELHAEKLRELVAQGFSLNPPAVADILRELQAMSDEGLLPEFLQSIREHTDLPPRLSPDPTCMEALMIQLYVCRDALIQ